MQPVVLWNTLRFSSEDDWAVFAGQNMIAHEALFQAITGAGDGAYPRSQFLTTSEQDQIAHWQEHVAIAQALSEDPPSLIDMSFDPQDETAFYIFLSNHAYYHQTQQTAAGITG